MERSPSNSSFLWKLGILNFLFVSSYSAFGVHALFLFQKENLEILRPSIIIGMSVFAATQVGGVWLLSLFHSSLNKSRPLLWIFRIAAPVLMSLPYKGSIICGFLFFGLSHSIFYIRSRELLAKKMKQTQTEDSKGYALFGITTNLSFLCMPILGGLLIHYSSSLLIPLGLSIISGIAGLFLLGILETSLPLIEKSPALDNAGAAKTNKEISDFSVSTYMLDTLRFLGFILPYAVMIALMPIKLSEAGKSAQINSYMVAGNGIVVVLFQLFYFVRSKREYSMRSYDFVSVGAMLIFAVSLLSPLNIIVPLFLIWSFCEAYQLPAIEYLLFSKRNYSGKRLNRILALDAAICFAGPLMAEHLSRTIFH